MRFISCGVSSRFDRKLGTRIDTQRLGRQRGRNNSTRSGDFSPAPLDQYMAGSTRRLMALSLPIEPSDKFGVISAAVADVVVERRLGSLTSRPGSGAGAGSFARARGLPRAATQDDMNSSRLTHLAARRSRGKIELMAQKQLRLGAFMRPVSIHTAAWRYPGGTPDANFNLKALIAYAQTLERGKFDAFFMADHLAVLNMPMEALKRSATVTSFDPLTLLPALAQHTQHLGLIATASTTFEPAYTIARRFASLDHLSNGRAGWNLVTTSNPDAALNFGMDEQMEHGERYRRAREFFDVVTGLWDSWAEDAFIRDVEAGIYFDPAKLHVLNHKGKYLKVKGPLNVARPIQGWPVIVQAG